MFNFFFLLHIIARGLAARQTYDVLLDVKRKREKLAAKQKKAAAKVIFVFKNYVLINSLYSFQYYLHFFEY